MESKLIQPLKTAMWRFLNNLKLELLFDPAVPHLVIYSKDPVFYLKDVWSPIFIVSLITISRKQNQPRWPLSDSCIEKI